MEPSSASVHLEHLDATLNTQDGEMECRCHVRIPLQCHHFESCCSRAGRAEEAGGSERRCHGRAKTASASTSTPTHHPRIHTSTAPPKKESVHSRDSKGQGIFDDAPLKLAPPTPAPKNRLTRVTDEGRTDDYATDQLQLRPGVVTGPGLLVCLCFRGKEQES